MRDSEREGGGWEGCSGGGGGGGVVTVGWGERVCDSRLPFVRWWGTPTYSIPFLRCFGITSSVSAYSGVPLGHASAMSNVDGFH